MFKIYVITHEETKMHLINICVRKHNGKKILSAIIAGDGWHDMRQWLVNKIEQDGSFPTPCTAEGFIYQQGNGWYKIDSINIPALEN
jgi:hypothetical protein